MRFPVVSGSSIVLSLYLSQTTSAQEPEAFRNGTLSWGSSPLIYSKRTTTCSGTCADCYGSGSIYCGTNNACFNPTIGESCCADYSYSCSDGYYCAPNGLDMQCCSNSISTSECTASIENGGGSAGGGGGGSGSGSGSGGLSAGAKAGIGIGVTLLILIIAGLAAFFFFRHRSRKRRVAPAPVAWQIPELAGGPGGPAGPGVAQGGYNGTQVPYNGAQGGYNVAQGGYDNNPGGYDGGYANTDTKNQHHSGGPPVSEVYTPVGGPQNAGYNGHVQSHVELPETQSAYVASPAMSHTYPATTEQDRARAAEMYGGSMGQNY